jgi:DNA-binding FadR family transcriptional regulator
LYLHRAVLDAVIARSPTKAEKARRVLIDSASTDIENVLAYRSTIPSMVQPAAHLASRVKG